MLETERLILRKYRESDLQDLYEYLSDEEVVRFEPYKPMTEEETAANLKWRISAEEMIALELKSSGKMIGNIYLGDMDCNAMEIGFVLNRSYWGKGYAREGCQAAISQAFHKGAHRIFAECDPCNENSWRLLETLGFKREAFIKGNVYFWTDEEGNPIWKDTYVYAKVNP